MPRSRAAVRTVSTNDSFDSVPVLTQAVEVAPAPVAEAPISRIHLIGGEKGGVGKSVVARLLAQHFIDHNLAFTGFDTDRSHGALMRFYKDYASPVLVDRFEDRLQYVLVLNELRGDDFGNLERSGQFERAKALGARVVHLRHLQDAVLRKIDAADSSFWAARTMASNEGPRLGLLERQRLKMWLSHAASEIAAAGV